MAHLHTFSLSQNFRVKTGLTRLTSVHASCLACGLALIPHLAMAQTHSMQESVISSSNFSTPAHSLELNPQNLSETNALSRNENRLYYHEIAPVLPSTQNEKPQPLPPTALLLGGGPGFSSWNLEPIQQLVANLGYHSLLMDMRGIGENAHLVTNSQSQSNTPDAVVQNWVDDIHHLLQHIHAKNAANENITDSTNKTTLIGHSWGALMAMLYARAHPQSVEKIILLNPVDPEKLAMQDLTENIHQRNLREMEAQWDSDDAWDNEIVSIESEEQARTITQMQITQVLPTYFYRYDQGQAYAQKFSYDDFNIDLNVNAWKAYDANPITFEQIRSWSLEIDFLDCRQDPLMPQNLNAMEPHKVLNEVIVLDQCGHFPWVEQPQAFEQAMKKLL